MLMSDHAQARSHPSVSLNGNVGRRSAETIDNRSSSRNGAEYRTVSVSPRDTNPQTRVDKPHSADRIAQYGGVFLQRTPKQHRPATQSNAPATS